jgi:hypothetical protein
MKIQFMKVYFADILSLITPSLSQNPFKYSAQAIFHHHCFEKKVCSILHKNGTLK